MNQIYRHESHPVVGVFTDCLTNLFNQSKKYFVGLFCMLLINLLSVQITHAQTWSASRYLVGWFGDSPVNTPNATPDNVAPLSNFVSSPMTAGAGIDLTYINEGTGAGITIFRMANVNSTDFAAAVSNNDYITSTITVPSTGGLLYRLTQSRTNTVSSASGGNLTYNLVIKDLTTNLSTTFISNAAATTTATTTTALTPYLFTAGRSYELRWYISTGAATSVTRALDNPQLFFQSATAPNCPLGLGFQSVTNAVSWVSNGNVNGFTTINDNIQDNTDGDHLYSSGANVRYTSPQGFKAGDIITIRAKYNDTRNGALVLSSATSGVTFSSGSVMANAFNGSTYSDVTYTIPAGTPTFTTLNVTGATSGGLYVHIDFVGSSSTSCVQFINNVFHDVNNNSIKESGENIASVNTPLFVNLIQGGVVVYSFPVETVTGIGNAFSVADGTYTAVLATSASSTTALLPSDVNSAAATQSITVTGGVVNANNALNFPLTLVDSDSDGIPNIVDIDDDNDGVLDVVECADINKVEYLDFAGWPAGTSLRAVPYPGGGNVTVNTVKSYKKDGVDVPYVHAVNTFGASYPVAREGSSLAGNYVAGSSFSNIWSGLYSPPAETNTLNLLRTQLNGPGVFEHELEMDFTTTTKGTTDASSLISTGGFYANGQGWTNQITISAVKADNTLETDYSGWIAVPSSVGTTSTAGAAYVNPWQTPVFSSTGIVLNPVPSPAYNGNDDQRWVNLQTPSNKFYKSVTIKRKLTTTAGYYDFEFWAFTLAYSHQLSSCDTDNDGIVNTLDLDSDGDGCSDAKEASIPGAGNANTFAFTGAVGTNGLVNTLETVADNGIINYPSTYSQYALSTALNACADTDNDGIGDLVDIDDDNDGVLDATESPSCFYTAAEASTIINVTSDLTVEAVARPYTNAYDGVNTTASYTGWALNQSSVGLSAYEITPTIPVAISSIDFSMYNLAMTNGAANTLKLQGYANNVWEDLDVAAVRTVINATQTFTNTLHPNKIYEKFRITGGAGVAYYGRTQEIYLNISNYIASANPKATCTANADGDLLLNHLDTDSDGDNCNDAVEASVGPKGTVVPLTGAVGANGLVDSKETAVDNGIVNYTSTYSTYATSNTLIVCADTDNDGIGDIIDIDDDNDGVLDVMEIGASCTAYSAHQLRVPLLVTSELTGTAGSTSNLNDYDLQTGFSVSGSTAGKVVFEVTPIVPMAILQMDVDVTVFYPALSGNFHLEGYNGTAWVVLSGSVNQAGLLGNSTSSPVGSSSGSHVFPVTQNSGVYQKYRLVGEAGSTIAASAGGTNIVREIYLQPLHGQPALFNSTCTPDADGDGTPNQFDLDSDNDGCSDGVEAGSTLASNNNITVIPTGTDANNNGLLDQYETGTTGTINYTSTYLKYATVNTISACADTDGDGVGDLADIDDDNDGITDVMEGLSEGGAACPSASSFTSTNIFRYTNQESPSTGSNWDIFSFDPLTFASAEKMTYGDGLLFREYGTGAQVYLLNYDADPVIGNSFYEFKFTTVSGTLAYPLLTTFTGTNFGVAATLSFRISEDNFKTSILLKGPTVINNAVNASAVFDVPFAMQPNKTYQLRVYVHSPQPTNGGQFDEMYLKGVAASGVPNLSAFTACTQTGITTLDTDGDGVPNHLDLDSDGDGCSDAIEGGASFSSADLVVSTMAGGNSGTSYTGTSTSPVTQNLGNTVTTLGVPTIATTGQTIGTSQDKTAQDANCVTCVAGTTAPAITPTTATNTCPATTVDLSALANTGTKPAGTSLIWSTHKVPTSAADTLTNLTTVSTAGKYYAMYFDKVGNCYSPADSVDVTITACNLSPVITSGTTATTPENVGTTTPVYTATATDPDAGQTKTFSFETGGVDNGLFSIDPTTGAVTFIASPDFEVPTDTGGNNVYDIKIKVCDNGSPVLCATKDVAITVTDAVECVAGTTAPAITPTTATNTCPATTVDLSALANTGTKPAGTSLIWSTHKVPTSAGDTLTNLTTVSTAGKYYALYFDKIGNCYSPADSVEVMITVCATPFAVVNPSPQTATVNQPKTGTTPTELTPTGGTGPYVYSVDNTGSCVIPSGGTALPSTSNLTVTNSATGAYTYTAPATAGTYYYCIKVCDSSTPTASCITKTYTLTVTAACPVVGAAIPGLK